MSDLKAELQEIQGVGEATAESVIEVLEEFGGYNDPYLDKALAAAEDENHRQASIYLRRWARK